MVTLQITRSDLPLINRNGFVSLPSVDPELDAATCLIDMTTCHQGYCRLKCHEGNVEELNGDTMEIDDEYYLNATRIKELFMKSFSKEFIFMVRLLQTMILVRILSSELAALTLFQFLTTLKIMARPSNTR